MLALALGALGASPVGAATTSVGGDVVGGPSLASTGVVVVPGVGTAPLPTIGAKSWVLADLTTGEVLAAKNPHRLGRPASTLKTLTAVTLLPVLDKETVHTVTYKEASADGGHVGIVPGATYTAWDLWHGLLLPSGNDAAAALAGAHGGMKKTVADMQATAARLQAADTTVRNPSGLDADGQVTSAYDLALIARAALAARGLPHPHEDDQLRLPGPHAQGRQGPQDVQDLHAEPAAAARLQGRRSAARPATRRRPGAPSGRPPRAAGTPSW